MSIYNKMFFGKIKYLVVFLTLQVLFLAPCVIKADDGAEFTGTIQVKTDSSITVNSVEVMVNALTRISSNTNANLPFDSLKVGEIVRVQTISQNHSTLVAVTIRVMERYMNMELSGRITALTSNSLTIGGNEITVDSNTVIFTQFHSGIMFGNLQVGDSVSVKAVQRMGGGYLATVIMVFTNHSTKEIELEGKIQAITSSTIQVMNVVFKVDSTTVIIAEEKGLVKLSNLSVGESVDVRGFMNADSAYQALLIKVDDNGFAQSKIELKGFISAVDSTSIVVNRIRFDVDSATVIFAHDGSMLMFSDLHVGDFVEVSGNKIGNMTYAALKIQLESDHERKEIEVAGTVDSIGTDNFSVGGYKLFVNDQTKMYNQFKQSISFASLNAGTFVVVEAYSDSGKYYASVIKVRDNSKSEIDVTGAITAINGTSITVKNITFTTDQNTEFWDNNRIPITLADLKVGQIVHIDGEVQSGNQNYALRVKVEDFWRSTIIVEGTIDNLGINSLTVHGKTFAVDSTTVIVGLGSGLINFSSLTVGLKVEIKAKADSSGNLIAKLIKVHSNGEFDVYGKIDSLSLNTVYVAGLTIKTDNSTVYFDQFDHVVTFDSLKAGQMVEINYIKTMTKENQAVKIEIECSPNSSQFNGVVSAVNSNQIQLSVPSFTINSNTVFINSAFTPVQSGSIQAGQSVTVWALQDNTGNLTAVQVQMISGEVTAVGNNTGTARPVNYQLMQNYPNPFNPTTNISFTLSNPTNVRLEVYNILGERVTTLINGQMNAGVHLVKFDGSNLASGVYFYRLKAGEFVSVKKMMLLK